MSVRFGFGRKSLGTSCKCSKRDSKSTLGDIKPFQLCQVHPATEELGEEGQTAEQVQQTWLEAEWQCQPPHKNTNKVGLQDVCAGAAEAALA